MLIDPPSHTGSPSPLLAALPAASVFVVALAWLLLLGPYGFQLEDEGSLLFWFDRVARGQQPYLDFHTGYTPGFFAFGSAVFSLFGTSATAMRTVLAVLNAATAAGLTELTRRVTGAWLAPIPALLWLGFMPVYVGEFAAFNVPYPTWPVTLAWAGIALAMASWMARPRMAWLVVAGAAAAGAMWLRPNSGAFALAATTWVVVAGASRDTRLDRVAAPAAATFMFAGLWYTFEFRVAGMDAAVHLVPALAAAVLCSGRLSAKLHRADAPRATAALAVVATAFVVPTLAWTLPLLGRLGLEKFLYEVFLVGAGYQTLYYIGHPAPEPYALLVVGAMVAIAGGGLLVRRGAVRPLPLLLAVVAAGAVVKLAALRSGIAPEGLLHSIVAQLENASYWLAATTNYGLVLWLWRVRGRDAAVSPRARSMVVASLFGVAMYMQMFPRSDFMHQVSAVPLLAVAACGLLNHVCAWWSEGLWPGAWEGATVVRRGVLVAATGILLVGFADKAAGPLEAWSRPSPAATMPRRLDVHVERAAGDDLEGVASIVSLVEEHSSAGEALWSFPATSGLLFAAGRTNAAPHDYWFPGRPDHHEEARVLAILRDAKPRLVVTLNRGWNFFSASPGYFAELRRFARDEYRLVARRGRYDLLARRGEAADSFRGVPVTLAPVAAGPGSVLEGNLERRRQAAWRWMDAMTPADAAAAALPADRRDAVLLLRALRDGGDLRGTGWAVLGFSSSDPRVRGEAVRAMAAMARADGAARSRFAGDYDEEALRPFVQPWTERVRELAAFPLLRPFTDAVARLDDGSPAGPRARGGTPGTAPTVP